MYFPKSMIKKIAPGVNLDLDLNAIIDKLLDALFGRDGAESNKDSEQGGQTASGVPGATLSTKDITVFQTRNLKVYAVRNEDYEKGDFSNAVFVANEVPIDEQGEVFIRYTRARPLLVDYQQGFVDRYVIYDIRNGKITEVSRDDYVEYRTLRYKRSTVISWYILGEADNQKIGNYIYPGVIANNEDVLVQAENIIPGITAYFPDLTEFLLGDISEYTGDPEVVNEPEPADPPPTEEEDEELEDLGFGDDRFTVPDVPATGLDDIGLLGDFGAADAALNALSGSIDEIAAAQDAVTAEQEALAKEQEERLQEIEKRQDDLEKEQELLRRKSELTAALNSATNSDGKILLNDIVAMSSKARRKKKRERLDQRRDEKKIVELAKQIFNATNHPNVYTGEEFVEVGNETNLKKRMRLVLSGNTIKARWTRDEKRYYKTTTVYTVRGAHAKKRSDDDSTSSGSSTTSQQAASNVTLTDEQRNTALNILPARERNRFPDRRDLVINYMKIEVAEAQRKNKTFEIREARMNVYQKYVSWKKKNSGNTRFSNRSGGRSTTEGSRSGGVTGGGGRGDDRNEFLR